MTITAWQFDQLQHAVNVAQEEIERLKLRIAALESGTALPPDQVIAVPLSPHFDPPVPETAPVAVTPSVEVAVPELDILSGGGLTAGGRRG